ncbi:MAG: DNA-3-methyladenine glycosylase [Halanaeroarchaeum sp.]
MERGSIPLGTVPGPFDLQATLESGQTFRWTRLDGRTYEDPVPRGSPAWYRGVLDGAAVDLRQTNDGVEWRSSSNPTDSVRRYFGLDVATGRSLDELPDDGVVGAAKRAFPGLRVVNDAFFPTLVSFVLSAQMRVERIHSLVGTLADRFGPTLFIGDETVSAFPDPATLATVSETELRDVGLGYRAPYVRETAGMVASGELIADDVRGRPYEEARDLLTRFVGVGEKVADCVLLFSLGYGEPVPIDTWIESAIEEHFPEIPTASYPTTSRAIRERLGPHPGLAQTYVFHYLRHRDAVETRH